MEKSYFSHELSPIRNKNYKKENSIYNRKTEKKKYINKKNGIKSEDKEPFLHRKSEEEKVLKRKNSNEKKKVHNHGGGGARSSSKRIRNPSPVSSSDKKLLKRKREKDKDKDRERNRRINENRISPKNHQEKIKKEKTSKKEKTYEEEEIEFPNEFALELIDALTCEFCKGIYKRPYTIDVKGCHHIFCLGCITKLLEDERGGICPKKLPNGRICEAKFSETNIKLNETMNYYINFFIPKISNIIFDNKQKLTNFISSEQKVMEEKKITYLNSTSEIKVEILPFKEARGELKLPKIEKSLLILRVTPDTDIASKIKKAIINKLTETDGLKLNISDIELRFQGIEISSFSNLKSLDEFRHLTNKEKNIFFYSKKEN